MASHNMDVERAAQFVLMLDALSAEQKKKVSDLGFDCLFKLQPILISRSLIATLSRVYQSDTQTFRIGEKNVSLTVWDAYCIMGLRDEGIHIDLFKREAPNQALLDIFENSTTHNIYFSDLKSRIITLSTSDENFVRIFVLLMVAGVLAQPVDDRIPWEYVNIVEDVDRVSKYNWAEFTVSFLHRSLVRNKCTKMRLEGNFILLQLWYYEHVEEIITNNNLDHHCPLMSKWTREKIKWRVNYERQHGRFHGNIVQHLKISEAKRKVNSLHDEVQMDSNDVSEDCQLKEITKELWISTLSNKKMKNKSVQQLPTKTPEKRTEKKKAQVIMIYDDTEGESEKHKSKKIRESMTREQDTQTYEFIQADKDISEFTGLTKDEMAAVQYVRNVNPNTEVVRMNGAVGFSSLTGNDVNCLIRPLNETGPYKWLNDQVINCGINIMNPTRHGLLQVMAVDTYNTCVYARSDIKSTTNSRDLKRWAETGSQFLENDLVFFPINFHNIHWYVGVLNLESKEFQILDSKSKHPSRYTELTLNLRKGIQFLISLAERSDNVFPTKYFKEDITVWPVNVIQVPQQQDDHSCGLFVLKFIELWEGNDKRSSSLEVHAELFRKQLVYQLIFSKENELKNVQGDIRKMAQT